jgi:hypothetical protein
MGLLAVPGGGCASWLAVTPECWAPAPDMPVTYASPSTYILDARGRVAWAWFGPASYGQLELAVTELARR